METVVRVVVIYIFLLAGMRILGKREFGQLSPHEFVVLLIIPEMVSTALNQGDTTLTNAVVGTCTIFGLVFLTSMLTQRFKGFGKLVTDTEAVLVFNGTPIEDTMNRERVTPEDVMTEARKAGVMSISQIQYAILEPDGKIAIIPRDPSLLTHAPEDGVKD
jgi:uncharacterized membrane protein YcaP (DUF421 family)